MSGGAVGEEVACCPPPPCKHMVSVITLTSVLLRHVCAFLGCFLHCCGLHPSHRATSCTPRFWQRRKDIQLQKSPFHGLHLELVPKAADIDSNPELTQIILHTEPTLSRASSQANWIDSPSAQPSARTCAPMGGPRHSMPGMRLSRVPAVAETVRSMERPFEEHWQHALSRTWSF